MIIRASKYSLSTISTFLFILFLVIFPKGGIKIASIPVTWGYVIIALAALYLFIRKFYKVHLYSLISSLSLLPFQAIAIFTLLSNGYDSLGFVVSFLLSFLLLPWLFFLIFDEALAKIDINFSLNLLRKAIYFLAIYGIILFFIKLFTGKFIEIPLITTNLQDWGMLEEKCNNRGAVFKLISTYNNGNLFGVCLLMLMPLYHLLEPSFWKKNITRLALLLTISRTVWIVFLFEELLVIFFLEKNQKKKITYLGFLISIAITFFLIVQYFFGFSITFLLDKTLGGRMTTIEMMLEESSIFSSLPFHSIPEIVYAGIILSFGIIGFIFFMIGMIIPLFLSLFLPKTDKKRAIQLGLLTYLVACFSDGAILYIPVMVFYWALSSFLWKPLATSKPDLLPSA